MIDKIKKFIEKHDIITTLVALIIVTLLTIIILAVIGTYFPMDNIRVANSTT